MIEFIFPCELCVERSVTLVQHTIPGDDDYGAERFSYIFVAQHDDIVFGNLNFEFNI